MGHKHSNRPQRLGAKLLQIRQSLRLSQSQLVALLNVSMSTARISEYETGARAPSLLTLLAYAKAARVRLEVKLRLKKRETGGLYHNAVCFGMTIWTTNVPNLRFQISDIGHHPTVLRS